MYLPGKGDPHSSSISSRERDKVNEADMDIPDPPPLPDYLASHARRASRVDIEVWNNIALFRPFCSLKPLRPYTPILQLIPHCSHYTYTKIIPNSVMTLTNATHFVTG